METDIRRVHKCRDDVWRGGDSCRRCRKGVSGTATCEARHNEKVRLGVSGHAFNLLVDLVSIVLIFWWVIKDHYDNQGPPTINP